MTPKNTARWIAGGTAIALIASSFAIASPAMAAKKKKKPYKVTATAPASVKTSHNVTISGKVSPKSTATVKLQRYTGGKWVTLASKKLSKASKYSFTTSAGKTATTLSYRVSKAKTKKYKAGVSKTVKVKVVTWGTVKAWGYNTYGQLGNGTVGGPGPLSPANVKGLTEVTKVVTNLAGVTGFALRRDGTVASWGDNTSGVLGRGTDGGADGTPKAIPTLAGVTDIAEAGSTGYALKADGTVWSWGYGGSGELGADLSNRNKPGKIAGLTNVKSIVASRYSAYALKKDGTVWAWGDNTAGELGQGLTGGLSVTPLKVVNLTGITSIAAGGRGAAAVGAYGQVWTWGLNSDGQLGNNTIGGSSGIPTAVGGLSGVTKIAGSYATFYAVGPYGLVWAWGDDASDALGTGGLITDSPLPVRVTGLTGVTYIGGFNEGGYAVRGGVLKAWGGNSNFLLARAGGNAPTPITTSLTNVTGTSAGSSMAYAVIG